LHVPDLATLTTDPKHRSLLNDHPQLLRQLELRERIARVQIPPLDPQQLPKHLKPLEECSDGQTVYLFGIYRLRPTATTASELPYQKWEEPLADERLPVESPKGQVALPASPSIDSMLDDAIRILEDDRQPPHVRQTALLVCEAIQSLFCFGGEAQSDPRLWLACVLGGLFERLKVEQVQHYALEKLKKPVHGRKGGQVSKRPGLWDERCKKHLDNLKAGESKHESCRLIALAECERKSGEDYDDWEKKVKGRQRTIYNEIESQIAKRTESQAPASRPAS
jgi:hypothetical protein